MTSCPVALLVKSELQWLYIARNLRTNYVMYVIFFCVQSIGWKGSVSVRHSVLCGKDTTSTGSTSSLSKQFISWWSLHFTQSCRLGREGWVGCWYYSHGLCGAWMCVCVCVILCRCAHVMVCETDENRILAEFMLSTIVKFIQEYVTSHEQGNAEVSNNNNIM